MLISPGFISLEEQRDQLTLDLLNNGHDIIWLGQKLPSFTTMKYALAPFLPSTEAVISGSNQTWTANTTLYDTTLTCQKPASIFRTPNDTQKITISDGRDCSIPSVFELCAGIVSADFPQNMSVSYASVCAPSAHEFLAAVRWEDGSCLGDSKGNSSFLAMFCRANYFQQTVEVTVSLPDLSVQSTRPISEKEELSTNYFNFTVFEQVIVDEVVSQEDQNSSSPQADDIDRRDISAATVLSQDVIFQKLKVISQSSLASFAIQLSGLPATSLFQPENLQNAFEDAHQFLFALAARAVLRAPSNTTLAMTGIAESSIGAVVMVPVFTYLVIGFLCLVVALAITLLCIYKTRKLNLPYGPNSIASMMVLIHRRQDLDLACEFVPRPEIKTIGKRCGGNYSHLQSQVDDFQLLETSTSEIDDRSKANTTLCTRPKSWPWEVRSLGGIPFILIQIASIASVLVLHRLVLKNNGD